MSLIDKLKDAATDAVDKSKTVVGDNADKINSAIDSVTSTADARTGGKYTDKISKLKDTAKGGVSSLGGETAAAPEADIPEAEIVEG